MFILICVDLKLVSLSGFALPLSWVIFRAAHCVGNHSPSPALSINTKDNVSETCCSPDVETHETVVILHFLASLLTDQLAVDSAWMMLFRFVKVDLF